MSSYSFSQKSRKILKIALPAGGNSLLDILNIAIGMYFISQISSDPQTAKEHLAALGLGMNFWMFLFALTTIAYIGTNAQISRAFGEKNISKANKILGTMTLGVLVCSLPIYLLARFLSESFFDWMDLGETTKELGMLYLKWILCGIPALFLKTIFISALSATGDTKTAFYIKIFATLLNIFLNYLLIFGYPTLGIAQYGIVGAGMSNMIITYFETLILGVILCRFHKHLQLRFCFSQNFLKNALKIGIPSGLERGFTILSLTLITKFMADYGLEVITGFQIGSRVESFILMPGFGFQVAAMALVGQMLGAKRIDLAESFVKTILWLSCITMGILGILLCIFGVELSQIFSEDSAVIRYSFYYLLAVGISQIPLIAIFVLDGALRGCGATKLSLWINTLSIWILRILPMWLCTRFNLNAELIFAIICAETFIRGAIFSIVFKKGIWKHYIARL
ncbi:MATE family efflux transporter [Helicobacter sp. MIT 05-5293]|uniref:MATE family efflux transporter n=1 Tax=Helicobacter sp. MIT 05-5293 TaxID=1548149 RepID=UPI00051D93A3|nr:MATE family efflux transporter [Helicobacter sp. MIT 05-5293]TLD81870.1 MATE family efflux transporter [Helicobacter sp. MIT 05-5293]